MTSSIVHITQKLTNRRNLLFLLLFIALQLFFYIAVYLDGWNPEQFKAFYKINLKISALWITAVVSSELSSGFLAKQLTSGMSRNLLAGLLIRRMLVYAGLFYCGICLFAYGIVILHPEGGKMYTTILGFPFSGILLVTFLSLYLSLLIKRILPALVATYFAGQLDMIPARLIRKYGNPDFTLLCPYHTAEELLTPEGPPIYAGKVLAVLLFTGLLAKLSYKRILNMDFQ